MFLFLRQFLLINGRVPYISPLIFTCYSRLRSFQYIYIKLWSEVYRRYLYAQTKNLKSTNKLRNFWLHGSSVWLNVSWTTVTGSLLTWWRLNRQSLLTWRVWESFTKSFWTCSLTSSSVCSRWALSFSSRTWLSSALYKDMRAQVRSEKLHSLSI